MDDAFSSHPPPPPSYPPTLLKPREWIHWGTVLLGLLQNSTTNMKTDDYFQKQSYFFKLFVSWVINYYTQHTTIFFDLDEINSKCFQLSNPIAFFFFFGFAMIVLLRCFLHGCIANLPNGCFGLFFQIPDIISRIRHPFSREIFQKSNCIITL